MGIKTLIFAPNRHAAMNVARERGLKLGEYMIPTSREHVMGLDPSQVQEIVLEGFAKDHGVLEAAKEWQARCMVRRQQC